LIALGRAGLTSKGHYLTGPSAAVDPQATLGRRPIQSLRGGAVELAKGPFDGAAQPRRRVPRRWADYQSRHGINPLPMLDKAEGGACGVR